MAPEPATAPCSTLNPPSEAQATRNGILCPSNAFNIKAELWYVKQAVEPSGRECALWCIALVAQSHSHDWRRTLDRNRVLQPDALEKEGPIVVNLYYQPVDLSQEQPTTNTNCCLSTTFPYSAILLYPQTHVRIKSWWIRILPHAQGSVLLRLWRWFSSRGKTEVVIYILCPWEKIR